MSQSLKPSIPMLSKEELVILSESTLLLVEDDLALQKNLKASLQKANYSVYLVSDGQEALF